GTLVVLRAGGAIRSLERSQYVSLAADARARLDQVEGRDRTRLMEVAFSDALYALVEKGPAPSDSFIRPAFADRFLTQYGDPYLGIYDPTGKRVFAAGRTADAELAGVAGSNVFFRMLDNRSPEIGLVRQGDRLYWIGGAPIVPAALTDASPIRGYLVVVRPFDPTTLTGGSARSGTPVVEAMTPPRPAFQPRVDTDGRDSARVQFALTDIFAQQTTLATVTTSRADYLAAERRVAWAAAFALVLILLAAAAAWAAMMRWLVAPAATLARSVGGSSGGAPGSLIGAPSNAAEWRLVTGAVNRVISQHRAGLERFDRLTRAGRDGLWERDLVTGEWTTTARFHDLLGYQDGDIVSPLTALTNRLHPDDAGPILAWLAADRPTPATWASDARARRGNHDWFPLRIEASVSANAVTGRLIDLTGQRAAELAVADAEARDEQRRESVGHLLQGVAAQLPSGTATLAIRHRLELVGAGLNGTLKATKAPFDFYTFLQETAQSLSAELAIAPGVPDWVEGDRSLLRTALDCLTTDASGGRLSFRVELEDRRTPDRILFTIACRGTAFTDARAGAIRRTLETGEPGLPEPFLEWRAAHHIARALSGTAEFESEGPDSQRRFVAPLTTTANPFVGSVPVTDWETAAPADATFGDLVEPVGLGTTSAAGGPLELVADATVTISLDDGPPARPVATEPAIDPATLEQITASLTSGSGLGSQLITLFRSEAPSRVEAIEQAVGSGDWAALRSRANDLKGMCALIGAAPLAARCVALAEATGPAALAAAGAVRMELERVEVLLDGLAGAQASA
ncbi:MAG: Hpt domain-containing protein, partial [Gemmatimonadales bacterium]